MVDDKALTERSTTTRRVSRPAGRGRSPRRIATIIATGICIVAGSAHAGPANDADRVGGYVYDVGILRTTGLLKVVIGSVLWLPAYPMAIASEQKRTVTERLVTEPAHDTFERPLGDF